MNCKKYPALCRVTLAIVFLPIAALADSRIEAEDASVAEPAAIQTETTDVPGEEATPKKNERYPTRSMRAPTFIHGSVP